ncbi:MAG TPA: diguanylate cyclase [Kangiella sp.]|uniref:GGDEF domain-containing protein n=1 Tax=Kangiella sp. TaxID=1920245 RepID=UPI002F93A3E0
MTEPNQSSVTAKWQLILDQAMDRLIVLLVLCTIPAVISSLARIPEMGFQISMLFHIVVGLLMITVAVFRNILSFHVKTNAVLTLSVTISVVGLWDWGLVGNGFVWMLLSASLFALIYGGRAVLIFNSIFIGYSIFIAVLYINGTLSIPVSHNEYSHSLSAWSTAIIGAAMPLIIVSYAITALVKKAGLLIVALEDQKHKATQLAERDPLTGLYNLRVLNNRLEHALQLSDRQPMQVYLLNIDLDDFKQINDRYGHAAGDVALQFVARCLLNVTRDSDTVCRVGGDEFLVLIDTVLEVHIDQVVKRIRRELEHDITFEDKTIKLKASIGVAEFNQATNQDISSDRMIRIADEAMYKEKAWRKQKKLNPQNTESAFH